MKKLLLIFTLLLPTLSHAVEWGTYTKVSYIYVKTNGGSPYIQLGANSMPGCYNNSGGYLSGSDIKMAYSTMLAAKMSGKDVRVLYEINEGSTGWGMCTITSFYLR